MKKVLYILGKLNDDDLEWMVDFGDKLSVPKGQRLIEQGRPIDALYLIISGEFEVVVGDQRVARLGSGEILGELSFLDSRPPAATVLSATEAKVFSIARADLVEKLGEDEGFASRFYLALGVFLATRLRSTMGQLGFQGDEPLDENREYADEIEEGLLDDLSLAGARFAQMLKRLEEG